MDDGGGADGKYGEAPGTEGYMDAAPAPVEYDGGSNSTSSPQPVHLVHTPMADVLIAAAAAEEETVSCTTVTEAAAVVAVWWCPWPWPWPWCTGMRVAPPGALAAATAGGPEDPGGARKAASVSCCAAVMGITFLGRPPLRDVRCWLTPDEVYWRPYGSYWSYGSYGS